MKRTIWILLSLLMLGTVLAAGQTVPPGTFQHIIIIVQENRSPDNLFGAATTGNCPPATEVPFETGVDIVNGGPAKQKGGAVQCTVPVALDAKNLDPNHTYSGGWLPDYDGGKLDGFCQIQNGSGTCLQYSYVQPSDVQPYYDIAQAYGWANYMFQTNEGPSFPAHQFLFTGTSAPVAPYNTGFLDFIAGNPPSNTSGCPYGSSPPSPPAWVGPEGHTSTPNTAECYTHDSLVTNSSGDKGFSWRYYAPTTGSIWDAPQSIPEVCYGANNLGNVGQACSGTEWTSHLSFYTGTLGGAPIFNDIKNCQLQQISWVIPDEAWSDHPGNSGLGPSWVGDIVDAIGQSYKNSGGGCDYWGTYSPTPEPTAIFVVWDDWGGWFDHVQPPAVYRSTSKTSCPTSVAPNGWGCGYVYGFRVPLLVVSEYTSAGYVSGPCTNNCPQAVFPYVHDFGSILAFTEYNFGIGFIDQSGDLGYADYNAPDWGPSRNNIPLSDFFSLNNQRGFTYINTPKAPGYFEKYYSETHATPTGPDADGEE